MNIAVTLIVKPDHASELAQHVERTASALQSAGIDITETKSLGRFATDLICEASEMSAVASKVQDVLDPAVVDHAVQPTDGRRKRLLIADMDSTMITVECIDELADQMGIKDQVATITEAAMRGELDFAAALAERVALLRDLPRDALAKTFDERVHFSPGAATLVGTMNKMGARTVLVSGGFTYFTDRVGSALGFQKTFANRLLFDGDLLTGEVAQPIVDSATKLTTLEAECASLGIRPHDVIAVGDGANDIPMLQAAGTGVAYRAKEKARLAANVQINVTDLTALLYIQGIPEAQWLTN